MNLTCSANQDKVVIGVSMINQEIDASVQRTQIALGEIIKGKRNISALNALKLSKYFGVSENFFIKIQTRYNLDLAKEKAKKPLSNILPFNASKQNNTGLMKT